MKNTNITQLHQLDYCYISGGSICQCIGGKNRSDRSINNMVWCMEFCCAIYGEADKFLFKLDEQHQQLGTCSKARLHLSQQGITITYKFQNYYSIRSLDFKTIK